MLTQSDRVIVSDIPAPPAMQWMYRSPSRPTAASRSVSSLIPQVCAKSRVKDTLEYFSVTRTAAAIERCDIAVLVIDAETGIVEQDKKSPTSSPEPSRLHRGDQ